MIVTPAATEIECFRGLVAERLGLQFEDGKLDFLADVLRQRMENTGCHHFSTYQRRISSAGGERSEICALAEQLTVGETYFFRYAEHFQAFADVVLPTRIRANAGVRSRASSRSSRTFRARTFELYGFCRTVVPFAIRDANTGP